jgi:hypothetical protein
MRPKSFDLGIFLFAMLTIVDCRLLEAALYSQSEGFEKYLVPAAAGVLTGFVSLIYFRVFRAGGSLCRFALEYWLVGATSYLVLTWIAVGLSVSRAQGLFSLKLWSYELGSLFPRTIILMGLGIGMLCISYFGTRYSKTNGR